MDWLLAMAEKNQQPQRQTCRICECPDKFDFHVSDDLWERVVPRRFRKNVVCLECFDDLASEKNIDYSDDIDVLHFAGEGAVFIFRKQFSQALEPTTRS
jgi:hypothetical protein